MTETLAIIPARGGSKAIKNKNIINLDGKPLIYYTIIEAQKSKLISRLVLNTDNKKIAAIGKNFGVEVPFLRPKKFAKDDSPLDDLIKHTLSFFKNKELLTIWDIQYSNFSNTPGLALEVLNSMRYGRLSCSSSFHPLSVTLRR